MKQSQTLKHAIELRRRLLKSLIIIIVLMLSLLPFMDKLFTTLALPLLNQLPNQQPLIATNLPATIFIPLKLSLYTSLLIAMPFVLYQLWAFVAPGLYANEKKIAWTLLFMSVLLFYLGILFTYSIVFPLLFKFFIHFAPTGVLPMPDISAYLSFTFKLFIAFGLAFEVPVAMMILIVGNIVTVEQCRHARPYVIVAAFVFGMLMTPPDVMSQILLAIPTWLLYECGIVLASCLKPHKKTSISLP